MLRKRSSTSYGSRNDHDQQRETEETLCSGGEALCRRTSALGGALSSRGEFAARRRADELDEKVGGRIPRFRDPCEGCAFYMRGRARIRGSLPRGYGRDDRAFAGCGGGRGGEACKAGNHADAADRGCFVRW